MTVFLVLLTVVVFLAVEGYLVHRRARAADALRSSLAIAGPDGPSDLILFHPGHTWVRLHESGLATVGASDLACNFAGRPAAMRLPRPGERFRAGDPAWTFASYRGRRLQQHMPLDGRVVAVNEELLTDPEGVQRSPYGSGWILIVKPRHLRRGLRGLLSGRTARAWLDAVRARLTTRLTPAVGAVAQDGGPWERGFGDRLDDERWSALADELFPGKR